MEKFLTQAGYTLKHGSNHDRWLKKGLPPITVPRHKGDLPKGLAKAMLKQAGIDFKGKL